MDINFKEKKILVTGAGRGIGRAVAIALSKKGCQVYALSRTQEHLDSLVKECPNVVPLTVDISNWVETRQVLENLEPMDGLVYNAAIIEPFGSVLDCPKADIEKVMDTNLYSVINCMQVIGKKMVEAGKKGSIVNISSLVAIISVPGHLPYTLSKAGVDLATKQFALELGPFNIRVNGVNPTLLQTDMGKRVLEVAPNADESVISKTPLERLPENEEIVGPILYFLSDLSSSVTGTSHIVDGGRMCCLK